MTTPFPRRASQLGRTTPDGRRWKAKWASPTTTVWPALLPPAQRATTSTPSEARRSTSFPSNRKIDFKRLAWLNYFCNVLFLKFVKMSQ